jgi:hypothetical protein
MNSNVLASFSLPFFGSNFHQEQGILDADLDREFREQLERFTIAISQNSN